ncbi:hypothetical protein [Sagittula sp. SSi028]|uniref:hypothetical protein n=1 Tax=Sagittula sp. SSi028 TaxID=3400636 RepID=UPI003AF4AE1D
MSKKIKDLEAQAALHRAGVFAALNGLSKASPKTAVANTDLVQTLAQSAVDTAKRNPLGAALIGVGAVMLLANAGSDTSAKKPAEDVEDTEDDYTAEAMRLSLHAGLDHLPPASRKRIMRKRLAALDAQIALEEQPSGAGKLAAHPFAAMLAVVGLGAIAALLWPRKEAKLKAERDASLAEAEAQLDLEETRTSPFPGTPPYSNGADRAQDRI